MDASARTAHCGKLAKRELPDFYLASLLAPKEKHPSLMALHALHAEIKRIPFAVNEPQLGEIRLQWWVDTLDRLFSGGMVSDPVGRALKEAIKEGDLPKHELVQLVEAHSFDLREDGFATQAELDEHLRRTSCVMFRMAARIIDVDAALVADDVLVKAGTAYGLVDKLRHARVHRKKGVCYIPSELFEQFKADRRDFQAGKMNGDLRLVFARLLHESERNLSAARAEMARVPVSLLPALFPASLVPVYLNLLKKPSFNALIRVAEPSQLRKQWEMFRHSLFEHF